jgi:hypothetical protein
MGPLRLMVSLGACGEAIEIPGCTVTVGVPKTRVLTGHSRGSGPPQAVGVARDLMAGPCDQQVCPCTARSTALPVKPMSTADPTSSCSRQSDREVVSSRLGQWRRACYPLTDA